MTAMHVSHDGTGYTCYTTEKGRDHKPLGCRHKTPREAIRHQVPIWVSPLRSGNEPLDLLPGVGSSPEPSPAPLVAPDPNGTTGRGGTAAPNHAADAARTLRGAPALDI